jgi:hypothetical protein
VRAIQRMVQAGAIPIETTNLLGQILIDHGGSSGTSLSWELQLLAMPTLK